MSHTLYHSAPSNPSPTDLLKGSQFKSAVLNAVQDPALRSYIVGKSVPWTGVDLPMVESLPLSPDDRAEVNLLVEDQPLRMVYRQATGRWYQLGAAPYVTSLPTGGAAVDGLTVNYVADDTNGVVWQLVYDSGETTYKWRFVGGPPLYGEVTTDQSTSSTSYTNLTTTGPTVTLPLQGDFVVTTACQAYSGTGSETAAMSYAIGASAAVDADAVSTTQSNTAANIVANVMRTRRKTGLTAVALTAKYRSVNGNAVNFNGRSISALPIRVAA